MDIREFSKLILNLYRATATASIKDFRELLVCEIRKHLPFDGVVWSTICPTGIRHPRHVWVIDGVPDGLTQLVRSYNDDNSLLNIVKANPGEPQVLTPQTLPANSLVSAITEYSGMQHVLVTAEWNQTLGAYGILTIGRKDPNKPFSRDEIELKRLLSPHLESMILKNFESQVSANITAMISSHIGLGIISDNFFVLMEDRFMQIMQQTWSSWDAPKIPEELVSAIAKNKRFLTKGNASFQLVCQDEMILVIASPVSGICTLTNKEYNVASEFSSGKSYKEVARDQGISPETVRSRLRIVYDKLSINDKAELSQQFMQSKVLESLRRLL